MQKQSISLDALQQLYKQLTATQQPKSENRYSGMAQCMRNVRKTNSAKKPSYCKF